MSWATRRRGPMKANRKHPTRLASRAIESCILANPPYFTSRLRATRDPLDLREIPAKQGINIFPSYLVDDTTNYV